MPPPYKYVPIPLERPEGAVPAVVNAAKFHGVPIELAVSIAQTESHFRCRAVSSAGAVGVMQVMPSTARLYGLDPSTLSSCTAGANAGVIVLKDLLEVCKGDLTCVYSRYNSGRVKNLKPETVSYIGKMVALME